MNKLYPFIFKPIYKEKIWGGGFLSTLSGLFDAPAQNIGEAWVLSGLDEAPSLVSNGYLAGNYLNELIKVYLDEILGEKVYERFNTHFPVLLKIIDATQKLSIQVHPNDEVAAKLHKAPNGKSEMWYIMNADKNAWIINGFNKNISKNEYVDILEKGEIENILNYIKVEKDNYYYIPAGRIHAVGENVVFAEVQQASNYTYRIYDWNRLDKNNKTRELHTDLALQAINFNAPTIENTKANLFLKNKTQEIVKNPCFTTNLLIIDKAIKRDFLDNNTFVAYLCLEGEASILYNNEEYTFKAGTATLVPAVIHEFIISTKQYAKLLEVYI